MRYIYSLTLILALISILVSCGDKGVPAGEDTPEAVLEIVSGNNQSRPVGEQSRTDSLIVAVRTILGQPVPGDVVSFNQISSSEGGYVVTPVDTTDDSGFAFTRFKLDSLVGIDTVKAVSERVGEDGAVFFVINTLAGAADTLFKIGPLQTISDTAGTSVSDPITVKVLDRYGNPVPGQIVSFRTSQRCVVITDSSTQDPPEFDTAYTATDMDGIASATWVLAMNPFFNYPAPHNIEAYTFYDGGGSDTVSFNGQATDPGVLEYYYDIRPVFIDNCMSAQCHPSSSDYQLDYYFTLFESDNLIPGDTTSLLVRNSRYFTHLGHANMVEEDKIRRWVEVDAAAPGSSGLNNYNDHIKDIIDGACIACHGGASPDGDYLMTTHLEIRSNGSDGSVPNAIPGDDSSLVVQKMNDRHNWQYLDVDSVTAATLADSISSWIVNYYMREY